MRRIILLSGVMVFLAASAAAGFEPIRFTMPEDGYVSMHVRDGNGVVVRQLLSAARYAKGEHTVRWDGLTTPIWDKRGKPVPAGAYTWHAIWHKGIGLRLRGWAFHGPSDPWDAGPTSYWGGDHALPVAVAADDKRVYLGWAFGFIGNAQLPEPVGTIWGINTNVGEWHILTGEGFYLTRLFQGDPQKQKWPDKALPGAVMDNCPSGLGGEDFGGTVSTPASSTTRYSS